MQLADRALFDDQLGALCAGFNVPVTELRAEAYWRGLQKMHLGQFARVVEYALSEHGPERIPSVPQCWSLAKQVRARAPERPQPAPVEPAYDALHGFAQRCLLRWLRERGGVDEATLARLIAEKNRLIGQFREIAAEETLTADEVRPVMLRAFDRVAA